MSGDTLAKKKERKVVAIMPGPVSANVPFSDNAIRRSMSDNVGDILHRCE